MLNPIITYLAHRFGIDESEVGFEAGSRIAADDHTYTVACESTEGPSLSLETHGRLTLEDGHFRLEVDVIGDPIETVERAMAALKAFNDWKSTEAPNDRSTG